MVTGLSGGRVSPVAVLRTMTSSNSGRYRDTESSRSRCPSSLKIITATAVTARVIE